MFTTELKLAVAFLFSALFEKIFPKPLKEGELNLKIPFSNLKQFLHQLQSVNAWIIPGIIYDNEHTYNKTEMQLPQAVKYLCWT